MIKGLIATLAVGLVGALIAELIRIGGALREGKAPKPLELVGSFIYVVLGAGAALYGWDRERAPLEVAQLGAAFPLLFAAGVRALTKPKRRETRAVDVTDERSFSEYLSGRF